MAMKIPPVTTPVAPGELASRSRSTSTTTTPRTGPPRGAVPPGEPREPGAEPEHDDHAQNRAPEGADAPEDGHHDDEARGRPVHDLERHHAVGEGVEPAGQPGEARRDEHGD